MKPLLLIIIIVQVLSLRAQSVGGQLAGNATVCSTSNTGSLSVSNYSGAIQRWELASSPNGPWSVMAHTFSVYSYINLNQTTWFRVVVQNGSFVPAYSSLASVVVVNPATVQAVSSATHLCTGSSVSLSLTGFSGGLVTWMYSLNNWMTSSTLATSGVSLSVSPTLSMQYYAVVQQPPCANVTTNTVAVTVFSTVPSGSVTAPVSVCSGATMNISVNASSTSVMGWETAPNGTTIYQSWNNTAGVTQFTLMAQNSTCFRVKQGNGICPDVYTAPVCVSVQPLANGGTVMGPSTICVNSGTVGLQLSGYSGTVAYWEKQLFGNSTWTPIASTATTLPINNTSVSAHYRAIVGAGGCATATSAIHSLTVYALPQLSVSAASVCEGRTVQPINSSSNCVNYLWRWPTGATWLGSAPVMQPTGTGLQTVMLIGTSAKGCQDSMSWMVQVHAKPMLVLLASDTACSGQFVQHVNNSSVPFSSIVGSTLNFGDGTSTAALPAAHVYTAIGYFLRKLKVVSQLGCMDSLIRGIKVQGLTPPTLYHQGACNQQIIQFSSSLLTATNSWQFGDGGSATGAQPTHVYALPGTYSVSLNSSDGICSASAYTTLVISTTPTVTVAAASTCVNASVVFSASVQPPFAACVWKTGDGMTSTQSVFQHTYVASGYYDVTLTVSTTSPCSVTTSALFTVYPLPQVAWSSAPLCVGDTLHLSIKSTTDRLRWLVNRTDTLWGNYQRYVAIQSGMLPVQLGVTNKWGCSAFQDDSVIVRYGPHALFSAPAVCEHDTARVHNQTQFSTGLPPAYQWLFSDGWESSVFEPRRYLSPGKYLMHLVVTDEAGCSDERSDTLHVHALPIAAFQAGNVCVGDTVLFDNQSHGTSFIQQYDWYVADTLYSNRYAPLWRADGVGKHLWKLLVKDVNGCSSETTATVGVRAPQLVVPPRDTLLALGQSVFFSFTSFQQADWSPATEFSNPLARQQRLSPHQSVCYAVRLKDTLGCVQSHSFCIAVEKTYSVHPYALVTADGNGWNDVWVVENITAYPDNRIEIIDQRGELVYSERNYQNNWDGKNYKGELLPEGTYYYRIYFEGSGVQYKGYLLLVR